ncbi:MAG: YbhB/YbcL family Raf kinase inhibitor-like protein [Candidatus Limnocylindrales bacterium]
MRPLAGIARGPVLLAALLVGACAGPGPGSTAGSDLPGPSGSGATSIPGTPTPGPSSTLAPSSSADQSSSASPSAGPTSQPAPTKTPRPTFALRSSAFSNDDAIPVEFTCDGRDVSPPLTIVSPPAGTKAFALIVRDEDAQDFVHWVDVDLPGRTTALASGARVGLQGRNAFGRIGYGGPCPPPGSARHRYVFALTALSRTLDLTGAPTAEDVENAIVLAQAGLARVSLVGTYRRAGP